MRKLIVFISSTGDLVDERDAVENALEGLDVDGSRFESWPSSPSDPIDVCLERVEESDALILLLGGRYGSVPKNRSISVTHLEYRHAIENGIPVFHFILETGEREPKQEEFLSEVEAAHFRCPPLGSISELENQVRRSLLGEFTRCFREIHSPPRSVQRDQAFAREEINEVRADPPNISLPDDPEAILELLTGLYERNENLALHGLYQQVKREFGARPDSFEYLTAVTIVHMARVNLAMQQGLNGPVNREELVEAISFWESEEAKEIFAAKSLHYNRGNALSALGRFAESIIAFKASLAEDSQQAYCWKNLSNSYQQLGDEKEAQACLERAISVDPLLGEAHFDLGTHELKKNEDPQAALRHFNRIIVETQQPHLVPLLYGWKAHSYLKLGKYEEGLACAESALNLDKSSEWTWNTVARFYALLRRENDRWYRPAIDFWKRYLDRNPYDSRAWIELGMTAYLLRAQNLEGKEREEVSEVAIEALSKGLELGYPADGYLWDKIGHMYQERGNWRLAEVAFRNAVKHDPVRYGYCLGVALIFQNKHEEALPLLQKAADAHYGDALSWFQVATCLNEIGHKEEALSAYENAAVLGQDYALAWYEWGGALWNMGKVEEAIGVWLEALSRFPEHELAARAEEFISDYQQLLGDERNAKG